MSGSTSGLPVEGSVSSIGTAVKSNAFQLPLSFFGFIRGPCERLAPAVGAAAAAGAAAVALCLQACKTTMHCCRSLNAMCHKLSAM